MDEEDIRRLFLGKRVKIVTANRFILNGKIIDVKNGSILFETEQATSLLDIVTIREIIGKKEGC